MKTYKEFIQESIIILERYYEPDEKLPSGKTPNSSANNALSTAFKNRKNNNSRERAKTLIDKIRTQVRHGADNPQVNPNVSKKEKKEIETNVDSDGYTNIKHKKSGVTYHVKNHKDSTGYEVHWSQDKDKNKMSPGEKVRTGVAADKAFKKFVTPRLRNNRLIFTTPSADDNISKSTKKRSNVQNVPNKRADIYAKRGFSSRDSEGYIVGKVRKGKQNKIVPVSPVKASERINRHNIKTVINTPENLAADFDKNTEGKKPIKKQTRQEPDLTRTVRFNPSRRKERQKNSDRKPNVSRNYSGNVSRNNPLTLKDLESERYFRDLRS
jgi:hypothetical protein